MKRVGNLWPKLISFPNLLMAAERAAAGKRRRSDVARLRLDLEWELPQESAFICVHLWPSNQYLRETRVEAGTRILATDEHG